MEALTKISTSNKLDRQDKPSTPMIVNGGFHPVAILGRPDTLMRLVDTYFARHDTYEYDYRPMRDENGEPTGESTKTQRTPPTPAGLAVHLGFTSVPVMLDAVSDTKHPEESRNVLLQALTRIEASLSADALMDRLNVPFTKFMLSARLGVVEKKESVITDTKVNINILGISSQPKVPFDTTTGVIEVQSSEVVAAVAVPNSVENVQNYALEGLL